MRVYGKEFGLEVLDLVLEVVDLAKDPSAQHLSQGPGPDIQRVTKHRPSSPAASQPAMSARDHNRSRASRDNPSLKPWRKESPVWLKAIKDNRSAL